MLKLQRLVVNTMKKIKNTADNMSLSRQTSAKSLVRQIATGRYATYKNKNKFRLENTKKGFKNYQSFKFF